MKKLLPYLCILLGLTACEEEYTPENFFTASEIIVEGYVENGNNALPPYVVLTKSMPYAGTINLSNLSDQFVHQAEVYIIHNNDSLRLTEMCLSDLALIDSTLSNSLLQGFGFNLDSLGSFDYCMYVDMNGFINQRPSIPIVEHDEYHLYIKTSEGKILTSKSTLNPPVRIDSLTYAPHNDPNNDTLIQVYGHITDPINQANFYRMFSKRNSEPMYTASSFATFSSVTNDNIFDGQTMKFDILRGGPAGREEDADTYGFFWRGDTITFRLAAIDEANFKFWQTVEFSSTGAGPFGTYLRTKSNINGGLGIFGAISYFEYTIIAE